MKYKAALIGCGRISFKHIEAYAALENELTLVASCDTRLERAQEQAASFNKLTKGSAIINCYDDFRQMIDCEKPHLVSIATESGYHPDIAVYCLDRGIHVICEKPMALSTKDADRMIAAGRRSGAKLAVCFQNRFNAPIQKIKLALDQKRFGQLLHGAIQIRWNRNEAYYAEAAWRGTWKLDGGTLMNQCTHGIDLLQWLMGENIVNVKATTRRFVRPIEAEDFGAAILEFESGAVGLVEGSACVFPKNLNETLSLFGQNGTAIIGGLAVNKIETWRFSDAETYGDSEETVLNPLEKDPPTVYGFGHSALFRDFVEAIRDSREPYVNGEAGKKALEIILAIYKSQKTGRAVRLPCHFDTRKMSSRDLRLRK